MGSGDWSAIRAGCTDGVAVGRLDARRSVMSKCAPHIWFVDGRFAVRALDVRPNLVERVVEFANQQVSARKVVGLVGCRLLDVDVDSQCQGIVSWKLRCDSARR